VTPRGIRNNNPLNIEHGEPWLGLSYVQADPRFCSFVNVKYGYRAAAIIIQHYARRGIESVKQIIATWAPAGENDVDAYVADVCKHSGFTPETHVDAYSLDDMPKLLAAMTWHENGEQPYGMDTITAGVALAGVHR
jgi:hypothetical protein